MPQLVAFFRTELLSKGENAVEALIARCIANGELSESCRDDDMRLFLAPALFASLWQRIFYKIDPLDLAAVQDAHVDLVTRGLPARP